MEFSFLNTDFTLVNALRQELLIVLKGFLKRSSNVESVLRTFFWRCPKVASLNGSSNQDLLNTLLTLNRRTLDEVIGERGFTYSGTVFSDFALIGINFIAGASWLG